jgi:hypothetical protein
MSFDELFGRQRDEVESEEPAADEVEPPEWWGPPERELGTYVNLGRIVGRSSKAVVALSYVTVYSSGVVFEFLAAARGLKQSEVGHIFNAHMMAVPVDEVVPEAFVRIGLELVDGTRFSNLDPRRRSFPTDPAEAPSGYVFQDQGAPGGMSGWGRIRYMPTFWLWPLPPPGPLRIWCEWPIVGVELTSTEVDATPFRAAAARVVDLWA